ncbi:MAG: hypothetical protein QXQ64_06160 [Candidatus Bathyarchaeia archaeon]
MPVSVNIPSSLGDYLTPGGISTLAGASVGYVIGDAVGTFLQTLSKQVGAVGYAVKFVGGIISAAVLYMIGLKTTGIISHLAKISSVTAPIPVLVSLIQQYVPLVPHAQAAALSVGNIAFGGSVEQVKLRPTEMSKRTLQAQVSPLVKRIM